MLACCGLCSTRLLPPSPRQLPSLLLWLQYSISLSAFEFQSKPEADCKQMDGVIKIPQAGSQETQGCKREALWKNTFLHPCWVPASLGTCSLFAENTPNIVFFTFTCPDSTLLSSLSTSPRFSRQPLLLPLPGFTPPSHHIALASEILGYELPVPLHQ